MIASIFRYFNSDFVFLSALRHIIGLENIYVSYDIVCQWSKNFPTRCAQYTPKLRESFYRFLMKYAIPKFHLPAHGFGCWSLYSLNFICGSARVDGEAIERFWSSLNPVATSTREMSTAARHDFIEERIGAQNFRKVVDLGSSLSKKLHSAIKGQKRHRQELEELTSSFEPALVERWKEAVHDYHRDPANHRDPYSNQTQGK